MARVKAAHQFDLTAFSVAGFYGEGGKGKGERGKGGYVLLLRTINR